MERLYVGHAKELWLILLVIGLFKQGSNKIRSVFYKDDSDRNAKDELEEVWCK